MSAPARTSARLRARAGVPVTLLALLMGLSGCARGADEAAPGASAEPSTRQSAGIPVSGAPASQAGSPEPTTDDAPGGTGSPAALATPTTTSTEVVPAPTDGAIPELPAVAIGEAVDAGGGLTAEVLRLQGSQITGGVPGDVAGPAVAVTVAVTNTGAEPADLGSVVVSAAYGDGQEAPGFEGDLADPLVGPVPAGETRRGTYVFGVPDQGSGTLVVRVGTDPARPLAVFTADPSAWDDL